MNSDFKDLLRILHECEVRYLVGGDYAVDLADIEELRRADNA